MQEKDLLACARQGDNDAFEQLVAPYERKLYAVCLRMMGSPADAGDALQDAMVRIWRGLSSFEGQSQFATWAYRLTTNACLDALRKVKRRETTYLDALSEQGFEPAADSLHSPEELAVIQERRDAVMQALQELAPEARSVLVLRDIQGESYEAVAEATGTALGTVKSRIYRAREKLAAILVKKPELFDQPNVQRPEGRRA